MIRIFGVFLVFSSLILSCANKGHRASLADQQISSGQSGTNAMASSEKFLINLDRLLKSSPQNAIYARNILKLSMLDGLHLRRKTNAAELGKRLSESSTDESRTYLMLFASADVLAAAAGTLTVGFASPSHIVDSLGSIFPDILAAKAIGLLVVAAEVMVLATEIDLIHKFKSSVSTYEASLKDEEDFERTIVKPVFDNMTPEIKRGTACNFLKLYQENGLNFKNQYPKDLHSYGYIARIASEMKLEQKAGMTCL
jgi:hypothetical protein